MFSGILNYFSDKPAEVENSQKNSQSPGHNRDGYQKPTSSLGEKPLETDRLTSNSRETMDEESIGEASISSYEQLRKSNIRRNEGKIAELFNSNEGKSTIGPFSEVGEVDVQDLSFHGKNVHEMKVVELQAALQQLGYVEDKKKKKKKAELLDQLIELLQPTNGVGSTSASTSSKHQTRLHSPQNRELQRLAPSEQSEYLRDGLRSMDRHLRSKQYISPDSRTSRAQARASIGKGNNNFPLK